MKIAITDYSFDDLNIEKQILEPLGGQIVAGQCRTVESLMELVGDVDYVITQYAPFTAEVIRGLRRCRLIVRYGIGVDNIDVDVAREAEIPVCNVPDYCIDEVAEHTLAMILALTREIVTASRLVRDGQWQVLESMNQMRVLRKMSIGVVGFGRIGREVVKRLQVFKCRIHVFDPAVSDDDIRLGGAEPTSLEELFAQSDLVTLHCPSIQSTRGMISRQTISQMKPGVMLVNVSRGALVETNDLTEALKSGQVTAAAIDVTDPEPLPVDHPLRGQPNVVITPHVAAISPPAINTLRTAVAQAVAAAIQGATPPNIVNGVAMPRPVAKS